MSNPFGVPEMTVHELAERLRAAGGEAGNGFVLVDVREADELALVRLEGALHLPLTMLAREGTAALPPALAEKTTEIAILCHHGVRSAQVAAWLRQHGWTNVKSVAGGIDAYAGAVDPTLARY